MSTFNFPFSAANLAPSPEFIVAALSLPAAKKLRASLCEPAEKQKAFSLPGRKAFSGAQTIPTEGGIKFILSEDAFSGVDGAIRLIPFTHQSFVETLDRLLFRKLRTGKVTATEAAPSAASQGIELPVTAIKDAILSWASSGEIDPKMLKLETAKALFNEAKTEHPQPIKPHDVQLAFTDIGACLEIEPAFFQGNLPPIFSAIPTKHLVSLDSKLTAIAFK